jgi:23S rRNA (guanosine2251-2'-O)-methyltransferase
VLIYGFHPVREALRQRPQSVRRVLVSAARGRRRNEIESLCRRQGVGVALVSGKELSRMTRGVHNGFGAELVPSAALPHEPSDRELVVLLEDVQDPRNLGAVLRVCEGAGVTRVLVRDRHSAPFSATVTKASAGATQWLELERVPNSANTLRRLKEEGYWVYGADATGEPPWTLDLSGKVVLCLGGEEKGLRPGTLRLCDHLVGLPMRGRIQSLNVATAAAALLFEAVRQRSA